MSDFAVCARCHSDPCECRAPSESTAGPLERQAMRDARDCEHGRMRGKCEICDLIVANARVEKLETALREIERRVPPDYGGTHYEGCEEHHDWCAVLKQARAALETE